MPAIGSRNIAVGFGMGNQVDINTPRAQADMIVLPILDYPQGMLPQYETSNNASDYGKATDWSTETFVDGITLAASLRYQFSTIMSAWGFSGVFGNTVKTGSGPYTYTSIPVDVGTSIELPYRSHVVQIGAPGAYARNLLLYGNVINEIELVVREGRERDNASIRLGLIGSGKSTNPSGITLPSATIITPYWMPAGLFTMTMFGTTYNDCKLKEFSLRYSNGVQARYCPGSNYVVNNDPTSGQLSSGLRIGQRSLEARAVVELRTDSTELATFLARTIAAATFNFTRNATNSVAITFHNAQLENLSDGERDGYAVMDLRISANYNSSNGNVTVVTVCPTNMSI